MTAPLSRTPARPRAHAGRWAGTQMWARMRPDGGVIEDEGDDVYLDAAEGKQQRLVVPGSGNDLPEALELAWLQPLSRERGATIIRPRRR